MVTATETAVEPAPGLYRRMSWPEYLRIDAANHSMLRRFSRSPLHALHEMTHPSAPTDALNLGDAFHAAILEPERFRAEYVVAPKVDRRTKIGKAEWAEFEEAHRGLGFLTREQWDACVSLQNGAWNNPTAAALLGGKGFNECVAVWRDPSTGVLCKGRLDRLTRYDGWSVVVDIKTTVDAGAWAFGRSVAKYGYHSQAAFYLDGLATLAPMDRRHLLIAIESKPPHATAVYELSPVSIEQGRTNYARWIQAYAASVATGQWPGYPPTVEPLSIPNWALTPETMED